VIEVVWPPPSMADAVMPSIEQTFKNHKLLTDKMLELTAVPPGPYALFHHNSYVHERMTDVKTIVTRLLESRKLLTELTQREDALRPNKRIRYGKPASKRVQAVWQKNQEVSQQMKLDMESLFIFGNLLLDQWALVIDYLVANKQLSSLIKSYLSVFGKVSQSRAGQVVSILKPSPGRQRERES